MKISKTVKESFWEGVGTGLGISLAMAVAAIVISFVGINAIKDFFEKKENVYLLG